jgi:hypothetical protein
MQQGRGNVILQHGTGKPSRVATPVGDEKNIVVFVNGMSNNNVQGGVPLK